MSKPRTRQLLVTLVLGLVVATTAAGCSSGDEDTGPTTTIWAGTVKRNSTTITNPPYAPQGTETEADYVAAFIAGHQVAPDPMFTGIDIECVAPKWVAVIGRDSFFASGVTPASIADGSAGFEQFVGDEDTAGKIVDAIPDCGLSLVDLLVQSLGAPVVGDPAKEACVRAAVTPDEARGALVTTIAGLDGPAPGDLVASCLS